MSSVLPFSLDALPAEGTYGFGILTEEQSNEVARKVSANLRGILPADHAFRKLVAQPAPVARSADSEGV